MIGIALLFLCQNLFAFCPFCDPGVIERESLLENEGARVFHTIRPSVEGHLLIVPKRHVNRFDELTATELTQVQELICEVLPAFETLYGAHDYAILQKNGETALQTVPHMHFHLIPATEKKRLDLGTYPEVISREELSRITALWKEALAR